MNAIMLFFARTERIQAAIAILYMICLVTVYKLNGDIDVVTYLALVPLALGLAWRWPVIVALLFLALSCFRVHEAYPFLQPLRLPFIFAALVIISAALHLFGRNVRPFARPELVFAALFTLHCTVGMIFAGDKDVATELWTTFIKVAGMSFVVAWIVKVPADCKSISIVLAVCGALVAAVAIYNSVNSIDLVEGSRVGVGREGGASSIGDPNDLAFVLMFAVAFCLGIFVSERTSPFGRISVGGALVLLFWAIIATKSRGGLLGALAVLAVVFAKRYRSAVLPLIACVVAGAALYALAGIADRGYSTALHGGETLDDSSQGRLNFWIAAVRMALHRPIFGVGLNNFEANLWSYTLYWDGKPHAVHSIWFGVLAENGFVGLMLYMGMIVNTFRAVFGIVDKLGATGADEQTRNFALALAAGFTGTCVAGTFLTQAYSWPVFMQVALIAALAHHVDSLKLASSTPRAAATVGLDRTGPYGPFRTA